MHWLIGNDCQPVKRQDGSTWYKWRVFIDPGAEGISWVRRAVAHLHPSFHPSTIPLQPGPSTTATSASSTMPSPSAIWTEARTGWGTFEVQLEVEVAPPMGDASTLRLTHHLDFTTALCTHTIEPKLPFHPPLPPQPLHPPQTPHPWVGGVERMAVALEQQPFLEHDSPAFFHGRLLAQGGADGCGALLPPPKCTWRCAKPPRDDHEAPEWLTGSEFEDEETALACKLSALASLLRASKKTVVYSGAGISVAAGIGQAARGSAKAMKSTDAQPTLTHWCLGELSKHGLLHGWIQQNHDGLPQKAGFPQELINEVHGSWYDPSNPVVKYSGSLKHENYRDMVAAAETADLVLVLGTSLGGLNADQVAISPAERSLTGASLGMVIINLQQTVQDGKSSLRIFGRTDDVLLRLLSLLAIRPPLHPSTHPSTARANALPSELTPNDLRIPVPYNADGKRVDAPATWLDLRPGAKVRLTDGHNIQGAKQIGLMHIGAAKPFIYQESVRQPGDGTGVVKSVDMKRSCICLRINGAHMSLGVWWLDVAKRGGVERVPVVNTIPEEVVV